MDDITLFGETNFRNQRTRFGIKTDDRRRHMYVIGKTGMGKTTMLENMVIADIRAGHGLALVDPHGDFAEKMLDFIPKERIKDTLYFNPSDTKFPIAFNPIESVNDEFRHIVASGLMGVFKKIWPDVWSARMEYILNNALLTLLEFPDTTILSVMRLLTDKDYRKTLVDELKDPVIKAFWVNEFARYAQKFETEATAAIQNKIGQLVANPLVRNILGQTRTAIDLRQAMDEGKILIFNLSKGRMGEDNSALLGSMIITKLQLAAMSRVDIPEEQRRDFYLYVDEFQNFATDSFASILSEARKYRLCLILAHQYIRQLIRDANTKVRDAVFGNVGTLISFRVGAEDAEFLEKEFTPEFLAPDILNLPLANIYLKLMIDGVASAPFSAIGLGPQPKPERSYREEIIEYSRKTYATPVEEVSARIKALWEPKDLGPMPTKKPDYKADYRDRARQARSTSSGQARQPQQDSFRPRPEQRRPLRQAQDLRPVETPRPEQRQGASLERALKGRLSQSFSGRKPQSIRQAQDKQEKPAPKPPSIKPKPDVDVSELKNALSQALKKNKEKSQN